MTDDETIIDVVPGLLQVTRSSLKQLLVAEHMDASSLVQLSAT